MIGPPDVYPDYGDLCGAWAQNDNVGIDYVEVEFEHAIYVDEIYIYETWNSGGVKKLEILAADNSWTTIWSTNQVELIESSRVFSPILSITNFPSSVLRLTVDCDVSSSWVEIDALKVSGPDERQVTTDSTTESNSVVTSDSTTEPIIAVTTESTTESNQFVTTGRTSESNLLVTTERTTESIVPDTTFVSFQATVPPDCCCTYTSNITKQKLDYILWSIRKNLTVPRNLTGRYNRSMYSADDDRHSSMVLGTTIGIITLVILLCPVIIIDIQLFFL